MFPLRVGDLLLGNQLPIMKSARQINGANLQTNTPQRNLAGKMNRVSFSKVDRTDDKASSAGNIYLLYSVLVIATIVTLI